MAIYVQAIEGSWKQPIAQVEQDLARTKVLIEEQQRTLAQLVSFMSDQISARRALGEREKLRKELCEQNQLKGELCLSLPSEAEIEALRK